MDNSSFDPNWRNFPLVDLLNNKNYPKFQMHLEPIEKENIASLSAVILDDDFRWCDSTFIIYGYSWRDTDYVFAWRTKWDEWARARNGCKEKEFYDDFRPNYLFDIQINLNDPKKHFILKSEFAPMNEVVIYFDPSH